MPISARENFLRAVEFREPEWIPVQAAILGGAWLKYREALEDVVLRHPKIFGPYERGSANWRDFEPNFTEGRYYTDDWGCTWHNLQSGLLGQVVGHPLADWSKFGSYVPPDPFCGPDKGGLDWAAARRDTHLQRERGLLTNGHAGTMFDLLFALRGFENLMLDFADDEPRLADLIGIVSAHNLKMARAWLEIGVDVISFHGDMTTQRGLMISPAAFRRYIKPWYKEVFQECRSAGAHVYYSCDGNLLEIVDDLLECGVTLHDPQSRACTLDGIARTYKGRMCFKLDLDQQEILPFGSTAMVKAYIREAVEKLYDRRGGFMISAEIQPAYPLENIEALCDALEEYCLADMPS